MAIYTRVLVLNKVDLSVLAKIGAQTSDKTAAKSLGTLEKRAPYYVERAAKGERDTGVRATEQQDWQKASGLQ